MNCPNCKYIMSAFDAECPRCARYNTPHPAPQPAAELPPPVAFVPSPYPPPPSDTFVPPSDTFVPPSDTFVPSPDPPLRRMPPAPPMHPVIIVFLGNMLSIGAIIVVVCVILLIAAGIEASRK